MSDVEETKPLSEAEDLEAMERAEQERRAELERLRELNTQKDKCHIGGETRRCMKLYAACIIGVGLYIGASALIAWLVPLARHNQLQSAGSG
jgi:hypothetical protein